MDCIRLTELNWHHRSRRTDNFWLIFKTAVMPLGVVFNNDWQIEGQSTPVHQVIINQHVNFLAKTDGVRKFWFIGQKCK